MIFSVLRTIAAALLLFSVSALPAQAQDVSDPPSAVIVDLARQVTLDPTTYAPAATLYGSMRLDWTSSQPFFRNGYAEDNARYTRNGLPHDVPISYADGNRRILRDAVAVLPMSLAHNATNRVVERLLIERFPNHRRLVRTLGWIERISFGSYMSYRLSAAHFRQWKFNTRRAAELGYR